MYVCKFLLARGLIIWTWNCDFMATFHFVLGAPGGWPACGRGPFGQGPKLPPGSVFAAAFPARARLDLDLFAHDVREPICPKGMVAR